MYILNLVKKGYGILQTNKQINKQNATDLLLKVSNVLLKP